MMNIQKQQDLFIKIARALSKKITVYAIGGTSMMLQGLKTETLDINLVFINEEEREFFKQTLDSLNYHEEEAHRLYGARPHAPLVVTVEDARIDLFSRNVLGVQFSDAMLQRAQQLHQFGDTFFVYLADPNDILIMKSATERAKDATERAKDERDIVALLKSNSVQWDNLIKEAENQVSLGNEAAILVLGTRLERLHNKGKFPIPQEVLDSLWSLLKKQVKTRRKQKK